MYLLLPFAPHPPRFCLPSRCWRMALADTRSTPYNNTITHTLDNKFMYRAQNHNIPEDDATELDGSHVSQKNIRGFAARGRLGMCIISIYFQGQKTNFHDFAVEIKGSKNKQTPPAKEKGQQGTTARHHTDTRHHRTQHRRAGHLDEPKHTTAHLATRPDRGTSDNTRYQKTTAGSRHGGISPDQHRTAVKSRKQQEAPTGAQTTAKNITGQQDTGTPAKYTPAPHKTHHQTQHRHKQPYTPQPAP